MDITLYNTLTKKKEKFVPIKKVVGLYACGPTVYHYAHIGNLRSFIFGDVLKRTLLFNNYKVKHVINITDVGHLTSDADTGEDKMLKGAKREKKTVWEVAEFYTKAFKNDIAELNIIPPDIWCKATEHIKEQIAMIQELGKKGFTYKAGGNVYFDTSKVKDYGKLVNLSKETKERVAKDSNKKNNNDFVLWFTKSKFIDQEMQWDSPFGTGYPGWHIECSAMSSKYLGKVFDLHIGGQDLAQIHHTNEIAQSEAAFGKKPWVRYWMHNEFLINSGKKMSKSSGEFYCLSLLKEKGFNGLDYRYFCLGTIYRNPLMFSLEALEGARTARKKLFDKVIELKKSKHGKDKVTARKKYLNLFTKVMNDDLNTPKALATMWEMLKDNKLLDHDKSFLLLEFDKIFGFNLGKLKKNNIPKEVVKLAEERLEARNNKDWEKSDQLREKIKSLGYIIGDTKEGFELSKK
jgi:cysteinyl-tRNA synthetase